MLSTTASLPKKNLDFYEFFALLITAVGRISEWAKDGVNANNDIECCLFVFHYWKK
jgi:hypothetical protein